MGCIDLLHKKNGKKLFLGINYLIVYFKVGLRLESEYLVVAYLAAYQTSKHRLNGHFPGNLVLCGICSWLHTAKKVPVFLVREL